MAVNVVELIADGEDCAFDQRCRFGHRVEGHAVYCHADGWEDSPRKCHRTWYSGGEVKDEDCPGFQPNPSFTGILDPTPLGDPECTACQGKRIVPTERGSSTTCRHCLGNGVEPQAMEMSEYMQECLERIFEIGNRSGSYDLGVLISEDKAESEGIFDLQKSNLLTIRSMRWLRSSPATIFQVRMTGKGAATLIANWAKAKETGSSK